MIALSAIAEACVKSSRSSDSVNSRAPSQPMHKLSHKPAHTRSHTRTQTRSHTQSQSQSQELEDDDDDELLLLATEAAENDRQNCGDSCEYCATSKVRDASVSHKWEMTCL